MELNALTAISPIDGRYRKGLADLAPYFSEFGLIRYRLLVEIEYFIALCEIPLPQLTKVDKTVYPKLRELYEKFCLADAEWIKNKELETNHDVKALEYFIKEKVKGLNLDDYLEFIHFGLTSQDVNNTSIPLSLKEAIKNSYLPKLKALVDQVKTLALEWKTIPMLSRTHGQPASPTLLGKEFMVFVERLENQIKHFEYIPYAAKFGGATGGFNAHHLAYPNINWVDFGNNFVNNILGLSRSQYTTQIEHYDQLSAIFDNIKRINTILIDFDRDIWQYIAMDYFKQKIEKGQVGSSAMPHKVNPIDFENSEGNLGIANAILEHLSAKLPISRLQRDLTDSTVLRNIGVPFAHSLIAYNSTIRGLNKLILNPEKLNSDLEDNWAVVAEAIQTILRRENYPKPYEALKELTRTGDKITQKTISDFIESGLNVNESIKAELRKITPQNYTGVH